MCHVKQGPWNTRCLVCLSKTCHFIAFFKLKFPWTKKCAKGGKNNKSCIWSRGHHFLLNAKIISARHWLIYSKRFYFIYWNHLTFFPFSLQFYFGLWSIDLTILLHWDVSYSLSILPVVKFTPNYPQLDLTVLDRFISRLDSKDL